MNDEQTKKTLAEISPAALRIYEESLLAPDTELGKDIQETCRQLVARAREGQ